MLEDENPKFTASTDPRRARENISRDASPSKTDPPEGVVIYKGIHSKPSII